MKGKDELIAALNDLLSDELTAINQYIVHSEMCAHWGYHALHEAIEKRAIEEMRHAEWHISRILFLEGTPNVSTYKKMMIGKTVEEMVRNDMAAELGAIQAYNRVVALAGDLEDEATADDLVEILHDEERHLDWLEKQLAKMEQMGLGNYLANQGEPEE
ncbi:MAG TPA: bacterioferritin [Chloroflexi bacterium]|nr:bacterioferritin [Chloroflexota bacterium]